MKKRIIQEVRQFTASYQQRQNTCTTWETPLVAVAAADDPLFAELKRVVIDSHSVPADLLPSARSVISIFLPFARPIAASNRQRELSSPQWATSYLETNALVGALSEHMSQFLGREGYQTVGIPATHNWIEEKLISNWSHRHVAFIAGLGRFGLNNMLITERGCSGRFGSLVTTAPLPPDERSEVEACLYKHDGSCRKCVGQCVNQALDERGFDRFKCYAQLLKNVDEHANLGYADVCGKCLAIVPCTHHDPVRLLLHKEAAKHKNKGE